MTNAQISLNALAQYLADPSATLNSHIALRGGGLVMDDSAYAQTLKAQTGGAVVHRHFLDKDSELYLNKAVSDWIGIVTPESLNGVLAQYCNEPVIDASNIATFTAKSKDALQQAHSKGFGLAVGCFSVGNPSEKLIEAGAFDEFLLALTPQDALLTHEYFQQHPLDPSEYPWLCGRIEFWLARMQAIGCACKTVVIGEYGRDLGGGANDGWLGQGWTIQDYTARCMEGVQDIYQPLAGRYGVTIIVNVFCAGMGAGNRWQSWNVEGQQSMFDSFAGWNKEHPVSEVPNRSTLGAPEVVTITKTAANLVNIRRDISTAVPILGTFKVGDSVTLRPVLTPVIDNFSWFAIEAPAVGWSADVFSFVPGVPEAWQVNLPVPYVSQTDAQAAKSANDCGIASLLMLIRFWFTQHGLHAPIYPTVDDCEIHTPLAQSNPPKGLSFADVQALASALGFPTQYMQPYTMDVLVQTLTASKPVLALVDYAKFNPAANEEFAHFCVVSGYSENFFCVQDPYGGGANYRISRTQLDAAMQKVINNALPYQGLVLAI